MKGRKQHCSSEEPKSSLRNITINLPDIYDEVIQKLIRLKIVPSRSEAIRTALREYLLDEFNLSNDLNTFLND